MQEIEHPEFQGHLVRDCFLEFTLTLMKNYKKFWVTDGSFRNSKNTKIIRKIAQLDSPNLSYSTMCFDYKIFYLI